MLKFACIDLHLVLQGGMGTDLNLEVYSMSDLEEDEAEEEHPGKRFMSTSGVFTYTNSTVLHPDDQTTSTPRWVQHSCSCCLFMTLSKHILILCICLIVCTVFIVVEFSCYFHIY